jgi:multiple sugar transport system permease protein
MLMQKKKLSLKIFFYTASTIIVLIWLFPFIIATLTSLKSFEDIISKDYWWEITSLNWSNFKEAWVDANMGLYFRNTFIITVPSVIGTLFVSSLGAFALSFYKFRFSKAILMLFVGGMLIPFQMLLIPVYRFSLNTGLYDTFQGVILFHLAFQLGFCTFFLTNFMKTIPGSIFESAKIDGANAFRLYRTMALPLTLPAMTALGILQFTWIWNDYLWGLIMLQSDNLKPVTLGLVMLKGQYISNWNIISAASLIAASVPLVVFLVFQRYFIEGLTVGAVKE